MSSSLYKSVCSDNATENLFKSDAVTTTFTYRPVCEFPSMNRQFLEASVMMSSTAVLLRLMPFQTTTLYVWYIVFSVSPVFQSLSGISVCFTKRGETLKKLLVMRVSKSDNGTLRFYTNSASLRDANHFIKWWPLQGVQTGAPRRDAIAKRAIRICRVVAPAGVRTAR